MLHASAAFPSHWVLILEAAIVLAGLVLAATGNATLARAGRARSPRAVRHGAAPGALDRGDRARLGALPRHPHRDLGGAAAARRRRVELPARGRHLRAQPADQSAASDGRPLRRRPRAAAARPTRRSTRRRRASCSRSARWRSVTRWRGCGSRRRCWSARSAGCCWPGCRGRGRCSARCWSRFVWAPAATGTRATGAARWRRSAARCCSARRAGCGAASASAMPVLLALGLAILATSRPYEGLLVAVPVGVLARWSGC